MSNGLFMLQQWKVRLQISSPICTTREKHQQMNLKSIYTRLFSIRCTENSRRKEVQDKVR